MSVHRIDIGRLRPARRLADGRVRAEAHITRAGVFEYMNEDGTTRRELREPQEVFAPDSLDSFAQVPVTNNHPPVKKLTAANTRDYMVGAVGDKVERDDDHVRASLMVADASTIQEMESGKVEVSCGYTCDIIDENGVHPVYGEYDARQTNIRGNHVAIVHRARAGTTSRVRMDGAAVMVQDDDQPKPKRGRQMSEPKKTEKKEDAQLLIAATAELQKSKERADAAEEKLEDEVKRADQAEGRVADLEDQVKKLKEGRIDQAEIDKLNEKVDSLTKKLAKQTSRADDATSAENILPLVRRRAKIEKASGAILGEKMVSDSATDRELMSAVIEKVRGVKLNDKDHSDDYVRARFDACCEDFFGGEDTLAALRERTRTTSHADDVEESAQSAHARYVQKQQNAWRQTPPEKKKAG